MQSTVSSQGQTTIPKKIRDHLHLKPGDKIKFFIQSDGRVIMLPIIPATALRGILPRPKRRASLREMDEAIAAGATERFRRSTRS